LPLLAQCDSPWPGGVVASRGCVHDAAVRALALLAAAAAILVASVGSLGAAPVGTSAKVVVASVGLSRAENYAAIAALDGKVVLSGGSGGSLFTSASDAMGAGRCDSVVVNPATLALSEERRGNCDDPRLYGVHALVVNSFINGNPDGGNVRIAHATPGGFVLGPIVMTYTELSNTDAEWVYGDGYLWVYDCLTTHGSELLRVSATTGTVLQTVRMPHIDRPLIAADADGFWLAPAGNSSGDGLYHVVPGVTRPPFVWPFRQGAIWMVAAGHSVWLDLNHYPKHETLLRFDDERLARHAASRSSLSQGEFGYGQPKYVGGATGIWTVQHQDVVRIDPGTAHADNAARVPGAYGQPTPVIVNGSLFVLESPRTLYRISVPSLMGGRRARGLTSRPIPPGRRR
jgi:hypothetical protein